MPARPTRLRYPTQTRVGAAGTAEVAFTARTDTIVDHVAVLVTAAAGGTPTQQSTATLYQDGLFFEGTYSGNADVSDSRYLMLAGESLTCRWESAEVGGLATMVVHGLTYPVGDGVGAI